MSIRCRETGRIAKATPVRGSPDTNSYYRCFPKGANTLDRVVLFSNEQDAIAYLKSNEGAGIRVQASGKGPKQGASILRTTIEFT